MTITPEAEADMGEARAFYERRRAGMGDAFLRAVEQAFERIERLPEAQAPIRRDVRRA